MRLNPDCVRDILLYIEENTDYSNYLEFPRNPKYLNIPYLKKYNPEEVLYHFSLSLDYGYIKTIRGSSASYFIDRLTPLGHEFIENIRKESNWNKTKIVAKELGISSLGALKEIAVNIVSAIIASKFNKWML